LSINIEMSDGELFDEVLSDADVELLRRLDALYAGADKVAIKKLSKNDRAWAWAKPEGKQYGFYVPFEFRGCFFPADQELPARVDKPHILQTSIRARWPSFWEDVQEMNYRRFTNKGLEAHFTVPPKAAFATIGPASFVILGRKRDEAGVFFDCLTVDSGSAAYEAVERQFEVLPSFLAGVFAPPKKDTVPESIADEIDVLIDEFVAAAHDGKLPQLIRQYRKIPDGAFITAQAQSKWLAGDPLRSFDPFEISQPGNVLRQLTTDIEFTIYRSHELRFRAAQALEIIFRGGVAPTTTQIVQRVVRHFIPLYQVMLDASQQRRTRVGAGFESHIRKMLQTGKIPYEEQAVVSTRRPDFVLPNKNLYVEKSSDALVLAAKTTVRERWKQVPMEQRNCTVFLATMDEKVTRSAVKEMANLQITLVVPESFKSKGTIIEYAKESNVLTFKQFFSEEIAVRRKARWLELGLWH
jgi:EcoRII C terminal